VNFQSNSSGAKKSFTAKTGINIKKVVIGCDALLLIWLKPPIDKDFRVS
jgi:hypothetical protein